MDNTNQELTRVFFGFEVHAPWPEKYCEGRLLEEKDRHVTVAFLGEVFKDPLMQDLKRSPILPFKVGRVGYFSDCLFLPHRRHPNVCAWEMCWVDEAKDLAQYRSIFLDWLRTNTYPVDREKEEWLCHVTLCRKPFDAKAWKKIFKPLPFYIQNLNLYESLGHSKYQVLWSSPLMLPFEEIEHTADIAYIIRGESLNQIYTHAQTALAFRYPALLPYMKRNPITNLDDIIINLNALVSEADAAIGCPFKAISFHGSIENKDSIYTWEMIVDV